MKTLNQNQLKNLYETDEHLWLEETIKILKEKRLNDLDLENLIEELGHGSTMGLVNTPFFCSLINIKFVRLHRDALPLCCLKNQLGRGKTVSLR